MKYRSTCSCVFPLLLVAFASHAQDQACPDRSGAKPAVILDSEVNNRRIAQLSPSWDSDEQFRFTWFSGEIGPSGNLDDICCFLSSKTISSVEVTKLLDELKDIRFEPAEHNGETLRVYVSLTIIGVKTDQGIQSRLFPNNMQERETHGINYSAPQRVERVGRPPSNRAISEFSVQVDSAGTPSNVHAARWDKGSKKIKDRFMQYMLDQCFIPGQVEGEAVAMSYFEMFDR